MVDNQDKLTKGEKLRITNLRRKLLAWYEENARDFPWRSPDASNFERIAVEVLLQRTRAPVVARVYRQFFPVSLIGMGYHRQAKMGLVRY